VQVSLLKSAVAPNQWYAEVHMVPTSDIMGATNGTLASGVLAFTQSGQFDPANSTLFTNFAAPTVTIGASGTGGVRWADNLGISAQTFTLDLNTAGSGLTQFASPSSQYASSNGTAFGALDSISIEDSGLITANFENGLSRTIGQVALATFANPNGLQALSGNAYQVTLQSGPYNLKAPGSSGAGTISPATLEASTVDLSAEFTGLITTQRAYSASSKIITTADQMLEELLNIKR
jgi:flagellar hook protein FlgE